MFLNSLASCGGGSFVVHAPQFPHLIGSFHAFSAHLAHPVPVHLLAALAFLGIRKHAPQLLSHAVLLPQVLLRKSHCLLVYGDGFLVPLQMLQLHCQVVVCDGEDKQPLGGSLFCSEQFLLEQRHRKQHVFQGLLVPPQLGQHCAEIKIGISEGVLLLTLPLQMQRILQTLQCSPQLTSFAVVTCLVIESDGQVLGIPAGKCVCLLEEYEGEVELVLLQKNHGDQVAQLAHLDGNAFVLLAVRPEIVAVELQQFLILVECLAILCLPLQLLALALEGLHSLVHGGVHIQ